MEERVKRVMAEVFGVNPSEVNSGTSPENISKWDSLGHMNLCLALEDEFGVGFSDQQVVKMRSYDAIVKVLSSMITK
jgi:acyl carrier protein